MLWLSIGLIVVGMGSFMLSLPLSKPLVDMLWSLNDALFPLWAGISRGLSTFVYNLWKGASNLPLSLKLMTVGLILLSIFALQQYAHRLGRPLLDLIPPPMQWPLKAIASLFAGLGFLLRHRLAATAFLILTFLMIIYFAAAILSSYSNAFAFLGGVPGFAQFVPTATPTAIPTAIATATSTALPTIPRELWDGQYATEHNRGTPPTEIAVRQAIAARDSALTSFRRWLRGEINWSSPELRLKWNDADAARTYFFQNVGMYPESVWPPRVHEVRVQLDEQVNYLQGLLDVTQKVEVKEWTAALAAASELDRRSNQNVRDEIAAAVERAKKPPTATATPVVQIIILPSPTPTVTPTGSPTAPATSTPTRTPLPTITPTPSITPTPTPDIIARFIVREKEAVNAGDWKLADFIASELTKILVPSDVRRKDLGAWLADHAENPLMYVDPPNGPPETSSYRPSIPEVCRVWHEANLALVMDGNNAKATRLRTRVMRWLDYYSTQYDRDIVCN